MAGPLPSSDDAGGRAEIDRRLDRIGRIPFRSHFHLRAPERKFVADRGLATVRQHAYELLTTRLAPAEPRRDGRQTPWGGHPVFRAQHATGTCCRTCLAKTHDIAKGRALTGPELDYVVAVICRWVAREADAGADVTA